MNGKEQRIAKLNATQQQRKQECIYRTDKAISTLLQNNERVSFGAIARIANVSVSYLYKYPEIKERIQDIRNQQVKNARKLTRPQTASEKSKQVFIKELRSRINTLEWEKKELKKQNEKMTGKLYSIGTKLDLFDRVNSQAIRQASEIKQLKLDLEQTRNALKVCKSNLIENNKKVTLIKQKFQQLNVDSPASLPNNAKEFIDNSRMLELKEDYNTVEIFQKQNEKLSLEIERLIQENVDLKNKLARNTLKSNNKVTQKKRPNIPVPDSVKNELKELDIKINSTLRRLVCSNPEDIVLKSIYALKYAILNNKVKNPSGFLVKAIKYRWEAPDNASKERMTTTQQESECEFPSML